MEARLPPRDEAHHFPSMKSSTFLIGAALAAALACCAPTGGAPI